MTPAELISANLVAGLVHPGENGKAVSLALPMFKTVGMPPEMARQVELTAKLLGEAIVALIEQEHEIVPKKELEGLRWRSATLEDKSGGSRMVSVHCRCDKEFRDPLLILDVSAPQAVVNGGMLIRGLVERSVKCPHKVES